MLPRCGTARHATFVILLGDEHHPLLFNKVGAEREMNLDTCFPPAMYYLSQRTEYFLNLTLSATYLLKLLKKLHILNISVNSYKWNKTKANRIRYPFSTNNQSRYLDSKPSSVWISKQAQRRTYFHNYFLYPEPLNFAQDISVFRTSDRKLT